MVEKHVMGPIHVLLSFDACTAKSLQANFDLALLFMELIFPLSHIVRF